MNQYPHTEEIDLVDVAVVVYRRKNTVVLTLVLSVLIAIGYGFLSGQSSEVVAVFSTGQAANSTNPKTGIVSLVMPTVESERLLTSIYIPHNIAKHNVDSGTSLDPTSIKIEKGEKGVDSTSLVVLRARTSTANVGLAILVMNSSLDDLLSHHKVRHDRITTAIDGLLESTQLELSAVKLQTSSPDPTATDTVIQLNLESRVLELFTLRARSYHSEILRPATATPLQPKSMTLCAVSGVMLGLFLGCALVFFLELLAKAKVRTAVIQKEKQ